VRRAVVRANLVASLVALGCGNEASSSGNGRRDSARSSGSHTDTSPLPLTGATPAGVRYRLQAAAASRGDDVSSSWCLRLRYSGDIVIDGDEFSEGIDTCGEVPAPRVSGVVQIDCSQRAVFVFGGAHETVEGLELVSEPGGSVRAALGELPPRSGFVGKSFILVADVGDLPGEVREENSDRAAVVRIPDEDAACEAVPGAPEGDQPFLTFPE
jgi:hypothetical protein